MARVAIVTGGSRGIGEAISLALKDKGVTVAANYAGNDEAAAAFTERTGIRSYKWDVGDFDACAAGVAQVEAELGPVDILVNNAGITRDGTILKMSRDMWEDVIRVNLGGCFNMAHAVFPGMRSRKWGRIVNIGSTSGFMGRKRAIAYSAAKGGIANLTRAMAVQLAPHKIRVNAIVPNKIGSPVGKDEFDPTRPVPNMPNRPGLPSEAAKAVLFLASDDSSFTYGENLFVDGGVLAMDQS